MRLSFTYLALLSLVSGHDEDAAVEILTCGGTVPSRFQIMYVQDSTGSLYDKIGDVKTQLPQLLGDTVGMNSQSMAGIAEFHDRTWDDGCFAFDIDLTSNMSAVHTYIDAFETPGDKGADKPEDAWSAVYYAGQMASWQDPLPDVQDVKIIIVMTDEGPHYSDMPSTYGGDPLNFTGNGPFDLDTVDCTTEYPDFNVVSNWLIQNDIYLLVLADRSYYDDVNSTQYWMDLIKEKSPALTKRSVVSTWGPTLYEALRDGVTKINCELVPENQENDDSIDSITCGGNETRFQLMYVQDGTGDMNVNAAHIKSDTPQFLRAVAEANNESLVGFSEFWDRTADKCFRMDAQLTKDWVSVNDTIQAKFNSIPDTGTDKPEDVWSAVYYAAMNAAWADPIPGVKDLKVIAVMTNEGPHYLNEPPYGPNNDPTNFTGNGPFQYDGVVDCTAAYPDFVTVANALIEKDIYLIVLAGNSYYQGQDGFDINRYWINLIETMSPELSKRTFNKGFYEHGTNLYDNLVEGLTNISCVLYPADTPASPPSSCVWHNH